MKCATAVYWQIQNFDQLQEDIILDVFKGLKQFFSTGNSISGLEYKK
ncbi:hypothetical protein [Nostoc sp.]